MFAAKSLTNSTPTLENTSIPSFLKIESLMAPFFHFPPTQMFAEFIKAKARQLDQLTDAELTNLFEKLRTWTFDNNYRDFKVGDSLFQDALYQATLILAAEKPRNTEDLTTLGPIEIKSTDRVVTSDRFQFDIHFIVNWINAKKSYQNPFTREMFNPRDQKTLSDLAKEKELPLLPDIIIPPPEAKFPTGFFGSPDRLPTEERLHNLLVSHELSLYLISLARANPRLTASLLQDSKLLAIVLSDEPTRVRDVLIHVATSHPALASLILKNTTMCDRLGRENSPYLMHQALTLIACSHVKAAVLVLQDPVLHEKFLAVDAHVKDESLSLIKMAHPDYYAIQISGIRQFLPVHLHHLRF